MPKGHSDKRSAEATAALEWRAIERVIPYARNPRLVSEAAISKVAGSIAEFGFRQPIVVDGEGIIIVGHTRLLAAQRLGLETVPVLVAADLSPAQVKAYHIADNRTASETGWDAELLELELEDLRGLEFDLSLTGLSDVELDGLDGIHELGEKPAGSLAERFGAPPFSVFDARQGYWQERKRAWQALGIKSELGRGESITYAGPEIQDIGYCARRRGAARAFREDLMRGEVGLGAKR